MQNGTTTKKIERQPNASTSTPPTLGPTAGASTTPMPKMPIALPCSLRSNAFITTIAGIGCNTPAASPSTTRIASTHSKLQPRPPPTPPASNNAFTAM